jgi:hypothetical protein
VEKLKAAFLHSVTILWARLLMLAGVLGVVLADPNIMAAAQTIIPPQYWPWLLIVIGVVTELARRRTAERY